MKKPRNKQADHAYTHPQEAELTFHPKSALSPDGEKRLLIDPMENVLIGSILIRKYLGISSVVTMYMWHEQYGLPIMKRPDGQWMTTVTAIDEWIFLASEFERTKRPFSRGDNRRADLALEKAQRRVDRLAKERQNG